MTWTIWLGIVSPHLSELIRALASLPGQTVTVVAEESLTEARRAIGWHEPNCFPARVLVNPSAEEMSRIIRESNGRQSVHIVGAPRSNRLRRRVLRDLAKTDAIVGLISEPADSHGMLGLLRVIKYRLRRHFVDQNPRFVLAMGQLGVRWFERAGYDSKRLFPFAYVTERPAGPKEASSEGDEDKEFRILYLGRIVRRKIDITVIRGLENLSTLKWRFTIVGDGSDLPRWKRAAAESQVAERIEFRPAVDNRMIGDLFAQADLLLLPSKHDGWGAVVNEALMCGVPVACSDRCGAADLLRESWRGSVFKAGSVESLRATLRKWIEGGKRGRESTERIEAWSSVLEGPQVAQYLFKIVTFVVEGGERPSPPWY
jgi:glycosyltransferase involved in cell wall biosynthesis